MQQANLILPPFTRVPIRLPTAIIHRTAIRVKLVGVGQSQWDDNDNLNAKKIRDFLMIRDSKPAPTLNGRPYRPYSSQKGNTPYYQQSLCPVSVSMV
jgi:hypothetical protein